MSYYNVPIAKHGPFSVEQFEKVEALAEGHEGSEVLIHCSTGNRAAAWFGAHLVEKHGMTEEAALRVAQAAGLNKPQAVEKLWAHLHSRRVSPLAGPSHRRSRSAWRPRRSPDRPRPDAASVSGLSCHVQAKSGREAGPRTARKIAGSQ